MIAEGRTIRKAEEAGTLYQVETPQDAADCMAWWCADYSTWFPAGTMFEVRRLLKYTTGCAWVADEPVHVFRFERGAMTEVSHV